MANVCVFAAKGARAVPEENEIMLHGEIGQRDLYERPFRQFPSHGRLIEEGDAAILYEQAHDQARAFHLCHVGKVLNAHAAQRQVFSRISRVPDPISRTSSR